MENVVYQPQHKVRIVTAASLFDGHDAAINIMRRIIQTTGCEVIHLGHDRSVEEVVNCAIQEDVQGIAMTSYQGGHTEYFKYMYDLLQQKGAGHIKIFGGGGGTILPEEIKELHDYGITRLYHPDDGRSMGLQGMINDLVQRSDFATGKDIQVELSQLKDKNPVQLAQVISAAENYPDENRTLLNEIKVIAALQQVPVLGITGTGGAGKSSMVDELVRRFLIDFPEKHIALISVDPSKRKTGGALLGDRIRMNSIKHPHVYMRSLATRQSNLALSKHVAEAVDVLKAAQFDLIILETSGIGQSDTEIMDHSDVALYIMTPEFGAATQLEKIDMLDFADVVAINKFDKRGALDAIRDVRKQYKRNHQLWDAEDESLPVIGTIASQFNDPGTNRLYKMIMDKVVEKTQAPLHSQFLITDEMSEKVFIIPPHRTRYLSEISENNRGYDKWVLDQCNVIEKLYGLHTAILSLSDPELINQLQASFDRIKLDLDPHNWQIIQEWEAKKSQYAKEEYTFLVRGKEVKVEASTTSLSHSRIPKVSTPKYRSWGDILRWCLQEMYQVNFHLQPEFILSKEKEKILPECLPGKVVQKEPIVVFIT